MDIAYAPNVEVNRPVFALARQYNTVSTAPVQSLYRSADGGITWQAVVLEADISPRVLAISPRFDEDGLLFLGTEDGRVLAVRDNDLRREIPAASALPEAVASPTAPPGPIAATHVSLASLTRLGVRNATQIVELAQLGPERKDCLTPSADGHAMTATACPIFRYLDSLSLAGGGKLLARADYRVMLWDLSADLVFLLPIQEVQRAPALSPDGKVLATAGDDHAITLWDTTSLQVLRVLRGHTSYVQQLVFSADSTLLVSGADDGKVIVWDVASGEPEQVVNSRIGYNDLAISADGKRLTAGGIVFDRSSGQELLVLKGAPSMVGGKPFVQTSLDLDFRPDGRVLATTGLDEELSLQLWDVGSGGLWQGLKGPSLFAWGVAFHPSGTLLASSNGDRVLLWDVGTGDLLAVLSGHTAYVREVSFDPEGKLLASLSEEEGVRVWGVPQANLDTR